MIPGGRPTKSQIWPKNSKIAIYKKKTDVLLYKETDKKGCVQTNKKAWNKCKATVILGTPDDYLDRLEAPEGSLIWTCEVNSRGRLSALTHQGKTYSMDEDGNPYEVTVLVHTK